VASREREFRSTSGPPPRPRLEGCLFPRLSKAAFFLCRGLLAIMALPLTGPTVAGETTPEVPEGTWNTAEFFVQTFTQWASHFFLFADYCPIKSFPPEEESKVQIALGRPEPPPCPGSVIRTCPERPLALLPLHFIYAGAPSPACRSNPAGSFFSHLFPSLLTPLCFERSSRK